mgnify:FL=1
MNPNLIHTIGILGGGQLGRMMCMAAKHMGFDVIVLDPDADCPCGQVADKQIVANYDDVDSLQLLLEQSDVVTYEFENVSLKAAQLLEAKLPQTSRLLEITQNRILEKEAVIQYGLKTVPYTPIRNASDMDQFVASYESNVRRVFIKTAMGGYDGKGQYLIQTTEELKHFIQNHYQSQWHYVAETAVDFSKELSVIVCRNASGETAVFQVSENIHHNRILHQSIVPGRIDDTLKSKIHNMALQLADGLQLVGTLAMELFLCGDEILVNELAPRPHNSGHYTLDACMTSQFEQHIRAICNLPLGDTTQFSPCVMVNVLGEDMALMDRTVVGKHKLHLYGKKESRAGRKMGHINIVEKDLDTCISIANKMIEKK